YSREALHHFTTSYALTFRDSSHRQSAQIKNKTNHDAQSGGSLIGVSTITPPRIRCTWPTCCTNVPNSPAQTFWISEPRLKRFPRCVSSIWFKISANTEGIKNRPIRAALAASRHFTQAEIVCVSSASKRIQTRLPRKIELAIGI